MPDMDEILVGGCLGAVVLVLVAVAVFFIFISRPFKYHKVTTKSNTTLTITANKDIFRVAVTAKFDNDEIKFERTRIKKGQTVDFSYPHSDTKAKIVIEVEKGKSKTYEV